MRSNRGETSLKRRRRNEDPMQEFDRLPAELRAWLANAVLPWRPRSVRSAFAKAVARTQDKASALRELDRLQARLVARGRAPGLGNRPPLRRGADRHGRSGELSYQRPWTMTVGAGLVAQARRRRTSCNASRPFQPDTRYRRWAWYRLPGSNGGPLDPQSSALTD
jgi:hypothetical protein